MCHVVSVITLFYGSLYTEYEREPGIVSALFCI